jgi:CRISPR-associated helicase cas3
MSLFDCDVHERRVETGWSRVELPSPWHPRDGGESADFLLNARFDLPDGTSATAAQRTAVKRARDMSLPGMLIVQETTGSGKTEAALMAAEIMAARTGRSGVLFALPTQATTDAMFSRELDWLGKIESSYRADGAASTFAIQLQHGRARLNKEAGSLRKRGYEIRDRLLGSLGEAQEDPEKHRPSRPYDIGRDEDNLQTAKQHHDSIKNYDRAQRDLAIMTWFTGRKKSMLSDFVVTTVDHVLFSSMRAPHLALRHLGLSRKIVIVDEVHSYSTYMNNYLERALTWLASYGVPVILLSATLSEARCASFADAYRRGLRLMTGEKVPKKPSPNVASMPFPSLAAVGRDGMDVTPVEATGRSSRVRIERLAKDDSLTALLGNALVNGGCALVVRNTVRRAQETYEQLRETFGEDVSLNHARFTISDRLARDADLLRRFGSPRRRPERPHRAIVVATQVVEQSLDVDFDLLVTDLAPIDLILQRMGRLHRHRRTRPKALSDPMCYVDWLPSASNPDPRVEPGSETIYGEHDMLLTAAALNRVLADDALVTVPDDVRDLVEAVYGAGSEAPASWAEALERARGKACKKQKDSTKASRGFLLNEPAMRGKTASLIGWLETIADDSEKGKAQVRDGEDSLEVILLGRRDEGGQEELRTLSTAPGASSSVIPVDRVPDRNVVRAMAMSEVRLPPRFTNSSMIDRVLDELEESCFVPAWQACPDLRGRLFLPLTDGRAQLAGVTVEYTSTTGLMEVNENDTELQSA